MTDRRRLSEAALAAIGEQAEKATPGPWIARHRSSGCTTDSDETSGLGLEIEGPPEASNRGQFARGADAAFIAAARTAVPALLDHIAYLTERIAKLERERTNDDPFLGRHRWGE